MAYLYKQNFNLNDFVEIPASFAVTLCEEEKELAQIYFKHLRGLNFDVTVVHDIAFLLQEVLNGCPDLLILSVNPSEKERVLLFLNKIRYAFPELIVLTIADSLPADDLKILMNCGVNGHLDRKFSRPQDLAHLAHTLIYKINNKNHYV